MTDMTETKFLPELQRLTTKHGPKLGLGPSEVVATVMVFPSRRNFFRFQEGLITELPALKDLRQAQQSGEIDARVTIGDIPLTRQQISRLSPARRVGMRVLWSLTTGADTAAISSELDKGTRRGIRTRVLTREQKEAVGIGDNVVTVTTLRLKPDSPTLRRIKSTG